jgi:hypothetical protein
VQKSKIKPFEGNIRGRKLATIRSDVTEMSLEYCSWMTGNLEYPFPNLGSSETLETHCLAHLAPALTHSTPQPPSLAKRIRSESS